MTPKTILECANKAWKEGSERKHSMAANGSEVKKFSSNIPEFVYGDQKNARRADIRVEFASKFKLYHTQPQYMML